MSSFLEPIWKLIVSVFEWIFSFFPSMDFAIPTDVMNTISTYLSYALFILPRDTIVIALNTVIVCSFSIVLASLIRLILDLIRIAKT